MAFENMDASRRALLAGVAGAVAMAGAPAVAQQAAPAGAAGPADES